MTPTGRALYDLISYRISGAGDYIAAIEREAAAQERERWSEAVGAVCFMDLRPDFPDGGEIILKWDGNRADWARLRAILAEPSDE